MEPRAEYEARRQKAESAGQTFAATSARIGYLRLFVAGLLGLLLWLSFGKHSIPAWTLFIPVALFAGLVIWHRSVSLSEDRCKRVASLYTSGLARVDDKWAGQGDAGEAFRNPAHPYADDLDIFGEGSLFQLLCRARTPLGKSRLADWLLGPASLDEALKRQAAAREIARKLDFEEKLALAGSDDPQKMNVSRTVDWANAKPAMPAWARPVASLLSVAGIVSTVAVLSGLIPVSIFLIVFAFEAFFIFNFRRSIHSIIEAGETSAADIQNLAALAGIIESEEFESQWLIRTQQKLTADGLPASRRLSSLSRRLEFVESGEHMLLRLLNPVLLWREQTALALEAWRRENGPALSGWLEAVADLEAIASIGLLTFERPSWTFPDLRPQEDAEFSAAELRHPLLPSTRAVANDVALGKEAALWIVSGSNMSGKSTLLRSVGLASVLAWAGALIPASQAKISGLQVGASLRANDSLQDNRSRFFSEIDRIRKIVDLTKQGRVLFLLDELFSGTNSHDRQIGAAAILRNLLTRGAIGLITTHDLALTGIANNLPANATNVHFEDRFENGELVFDYKLKPGVVARSNALDLMRAIGLDV